MALPGYYLLYCSSFAVVSGLGSLEAGFKSQLMLLLSLLYDVHGELPVLEPPVVYGRLVPDPHKGCVLVRSGKVLVTDSSVDLHDLYEAVPAEALEAHVRLFTKNGALFFPLI